MSARPWKTIDPAAYEVELVQIIRRINALEQVDARALESILREVPKDGRGFFSRADLLAGFRAFRTHHDLGATEEAFAERIRRKPVRTQSGVAPVTVLSAPFPCPGVCIFCPDDARMPKSYLASEPGAQRAAQNRFDPFAQTVNRIVALHRTGHTVDKIELLVLGGTWTAYPEAYQVWFMRRCFEALNTLGPEEFAEQRPPASTPQPLDLKREPADWAGLAQAQERNESAHCRCVGLVLETRPDCIDEAEIRRLRRLGATKIQLGIQNLDDRILALNRRGHSVDQSRAAVTLLRRAGFKIHLHWMPNLLGATPESDLEDFDRLFADPALRPDELKVYPCSLVAGTELLQAHRRGEWRPYGPEELLQVVSYCLEHTPRYCRLSRVIRDIPGPEIVAGSRVTNLRQLAEQEISARGGEMRDIRAREIRAGRVLDEAPEEMQEVYAVQGGTEHFLQWVAPGDRLLAFLRLFFPDREDCCIPELRGSALIREVHVYGRVAALAKPETGNVQHLGLGAALVAQAWGRAQAAGFGRLSVISAVGTRNYYRRLGFSDGELYQHLLRPPLALRRAAAERNKNCCPPL